MAIVCAQCKYVLTKMEILGHLTGEIYDFTKDVVVPFCKNETMLNDFC